MNPQPFIESPYRSRQFIAFVDDGDFAISTKYIEADKKRPPDIAFDAIAAAIAIAIPGGMLVRVLGAGIALATKELFKKYSQAVGEGLDIKAVPYSLSAALNLPLGHPRENIIYVGHPAIPNTYVPSSDFHKIVFESRTCELLTILMHLGAKEINISHSASYDKSVEANANLKVPALEANAEIEITNKMSNVNTYSGHFEGGEAKPLPENLVWYQQEQTWQKMVEGRLHFGAKDFSLILNYNEDFGVNLKLKATLEKAGIELGGRFSEVEQTKWVISGTF